MVLKTGVRIFCGSIALWVVSAFCALPFSCAATAIVEKTQPPIYFEADNLNYQEFQQIITASGNVKVQQSSYTFHSDRMVFNIPKRALEASGAVRFSDVHKNEIRSKFLSYDAQTESAKLLDSEGSFGPWIFSAKRAERDVKGNFLLERAKLSTCEVDFKKYHLYGYRIRIMPQKRLTVLHAVFRLGPVPILYFPYYYYSLGEKHIAFQIFPGNNQSEGVFARTIWGYPFTDDTYARVYLDYLSKRGTGSGAEFNYYLNDKIKGSVYGYRIDDRVTEKERWNARFFHWQRLSPELILQSNVNKLSDDSFPNDFFREDFNRVVRDFRSSAALTYQKRSLLMRLYGERQDLFEVQTGTEPPILNPTFYAGEVVLPKFELNYFQSPLGVLGIEKLFSASFTNKFAGKSFAGETLSRNYRRESEAQVSFLRNLNITRNTILLPKITFKNQWIDRPQGVEWGEKFIQKMDTEGILRQRVGYILDMDFSYLLTRRFQGNQGDDRGLEAHSLSFLSSLRPTDWFGFRFDTAHNLPRIKGESLNFLDRAKYQPLRGEMTLSSRRDIEFFFREEYSLHDINTGSAYPLSSLGEISFGQRARGKNYFSLGTSYFSSRDDALEMRYSGRIALMERVKLEGLVRTLVSYDRSVFNVRKGDFLEKEINLRTEWRCWEISCIFRDRKGVYEFLFNLELKLDRTDREKAVHSEQESEFYPWRGLQ